MKRATVPRGRRWNELRRRFPDLASGVAVVLALVGLLSALSFLAALPRWLDLQGAHLRHMIGTVTVVAYAPPENPTRPWTPRWTRVALLSVDGCALDVSELEWNNVPRLHLGQKVDVSYREGHSGRRYVEALDLPPDSPGLP